MEGSDQTLVTHMFVSFLKTNPSRFSSSSSSFPLDIVYRWINFAMPIPLLLGGGGGGRGSRFLYLSAVCAPCRYLQLLNARCHPVVVVTGRPSKREKKMPSGFLRSAGGSGAEVRHPPRAKVRVRGVWVFSSSSNEDTQQLYCASLFH